MISTAPIRDQIVADAKSLPDLITKAQAYDPALAKQLVAKPLIASKTFWGVTITTLLTPIVARYGLGWDQNTVELVSGAVVVLVTAIMRYITASPISGVVSTPKASTP